LLTDIGSPRSSSTLKAITKQHVLAHQELQHMLTEQAVLKRMSRESQDPFVVKLWWGFHDKDNLFLVMDFHLGGDLATQLARWGTGQHSHALRRFRQNILESLTNSPMCRMGTKAHYSHPTPTEHPTHTSASPGNVPSGDMFARHQRSGFTPADHFAPFAKEPFARSAWSLLHHAPFAT